MKQKFRKDHLGKIRKIHQESIGDAIFRISKSDDLKSSPKVNLVLLKKWKEIVGEMIGSYCNLIDNKKGTLIVEVKNSIFIQELKMMGEKNLISSLKMGDPIFIFTKIQFRVK